MQNLTPNTFSETLARITKSPTLSAGVLEDAAKMIAQEGCEALDVQCIGMWFLSDDSSTLSSLVYYNRDTGESTAHDSVDISNCTEYLAILLAERQFVVNDTRISNMFSPILDQFSPRMCAFIDAPIHENGKLVGVVCVEQHRCKAFPEGREWTIEERNFASSLADFMSIAIGSAKRHSQMRRTEMLLNAIPGMAYRCTVEPNDYKHTFVSEGCLALTGYTVEELTSGISFAKFIHPDDEESVDKLVKKTLDVGLPFDGIYRIITKDGIIKWVWERSNVVEYNPDGTPRILEGFDTDITAQQRLNIAEKERERIKTMLDATPLICNMWSRDYRVIDCNEVAHKLFEMGKEEYMGKFLDLAPEFQPDGQRTRDKASYLLDTVFREGKCVFEWMNQKLDGTPIPMEVTLTRVAYGDDYVALGYGRDLRRHKQMMADIAHRDNLLKSVNQAAAVLLSADIDGDIESAIKASLEIICCSVDADRVNIWRNEVKDGSLYHTCDYSWSSAAMEAKVPPPIGLSISHEKDRPEWNSKFMRGEYIGGPISEMSQGDRKFLGDWGMKSVVIIPLLMRGQFWGLFSIDEFVKERHYTEEEINILQSISLMMASTIHRHSLNEEVTEAQNRIKIIFDTTPLGCSLWDEELNQSNPNMEVIKLFGLKDKQEYLDRFFELSPEYQPNGACSTECAVENIRKAFRDGYHRFEHLHQKLDGTPIPTEITLVRIHTDHGDIVAGYIRDLREHNKMFAEIQEAQERIKIMFDTTPLGCNLWDENLNQIDANQETIKLFGLKDKQEYLDRFFELSPEFQPNGVCSAEYASDNLKKAFRDGYHRFEHLHQTLDGTPLPCEVTIVRVPRGNGYNVAGYQRDLREEKRMLAEIDHQNHLLETVNRMSVILLDPDVDKFESSLLEAMGMMGKAVGVDRVYIWKNHDKDGHLHSTQIYEWVDGVEPSQGTHYTTDMPYDDVIPNWKNELAQGKCINGLVRDMAPALQAVLSPQGILSTLIVPIFLNDQFWGFIGLDDCHREHIFTEHEELILRSASRMIANALIRNEMTHEIRTTAMQLESVVSNYPGMIWCVDRSGVITLFSGARANQFEFRPEDIVGKNISDVPQSPIHSEIIECIEKTFGGKSQDWVAKTDHTAYHMHTTPIRSSDGSVIGVVGSADDITSIARLQEHLGIAVQQATEANAKLERTLRTMESIMNNMDMFIYVNDPKTGKIFFINDNMKRAFGIEGNNTVGRHCYELFRGADAKCEFCPCHMLDKEPDQTIVWEKYDANLDRHIRHSDCYIDWPTGDKVHLQYAFDITELVAARELAERSSRSKGDFLAKMSHEIRTPMNAIIGMTELALREEMPASAREHAITVKQAGVNLLSIVNDILDFSKIESGNMQIVPTGYLLSSLINDVISIIRMRTVDSHVRFAVYVDSNLPNALLGDETRIRQILINLLGNAVKFTDKGYVSLTILGEITDDNTIILTMEVKDTGRGIKQDSIGKLFSSFVQLDEEANKNIEGAGLGLAISRNLVKAMDGEITVESEYGKGSTFTVTLPQKIEHSERLAVVEHPEEKSAIVYERREAYADSILYAITNLGVKCAIASNDEEFCEMLGKGSFPFIFISHTLLERNKEVVLQFNGDTQVVLLAEFGETHPVGNWSILSMPVHAISIANVFNGVSESFSYNTNEELTVRFVAPDARVLIVDDINTNLKVARGLLLPYEMEIDLCNSGMEAIKAVRSKDYDIVFMDHRMPEMDGVEATERIRTLDGKNPYYKDLTIVALTANAVSGTREMFLQSGFDDFLSKPIDTVKLNSILEKWIPKEKQKSSGASSGVLSGISKNKMSHADKPPLAAFEIEGLDVKRGITLSGGTVDYYLETLTTFHRDGQERQEKIRKCLDAGDLNLYTTHIHALKSASANIGADQLSDAAHTLEMAGQREDLAFIQSNNDPFLTMLERLLSTIGNALASRSASSNGTDTLETEPFKADLVKLKSTLETMDFEMINRTVDLLLASARTAQIQTAVRDISKHILLFEYEEANALIESLLRETQ